MSAHSPSDEVLVAEMARIYAELVNVHRELAKQTEQLRAELLRREALEAELRTQSAALTRRNAQLDEFASVASHELQSPLRTIVTLAEQLEEQSAARLDDRSREFLALMIGAARRLQHMVAGILESARVERLEPDMLPVQIAPLARREWDVLTLGLADCSLQVDPIPEVLGCKKSIAQLLRNLLANAIKFRAASPLRVDIRAVTEPPLVRVSVEDNGIGVPPPLAEKVFDLFRRLHTDDEYPGVGLGLALCRRIVEQHGGRIHVDTGHVSGARFVFTLPAALQPEHGPARADREAPDDCSHA